MALDQSCVRELLDALRSGGDLDFMREAMHFLPQGLVLSSWIGPTVITDLAPPDGRSRSIGVRARCCSGTSTRGRAR